jgi:hypothetical protein
MVDVYLNDGIPANICKQYPAVQSYGMYRVVNCSAKPTSVYCQHGEKQFQQFRPYCNSDTKNYLSMLNSDVDKWIGAASTPTSP